MNASPLEVELKFRVPDEEVAGRLLEMRQLGPFQVGAFETRQVRDIYFDTASRAFAHAGYAYRYRQSKGRGEVCFKAMTSASGNLHRRAEIILHTNSPTTPANWPQHPARDLALRILDDDTPVTLFEVRQVRRVAPLFLGDLIAAELSIDEVTWQAGEQTLYAWELEVEILKHEDEAALYAVNAELVESWSLQPELQSKFERGLQLLGS